MSSPLAPLAGSILPVQSPSVDPIQDLGILFEEDKNSQPSIEPIDQNVSFKPDVKPVVPAQNNPQDQLIFTDATTLLDKGFAWLESAAAKLGNSLQIAPRIALFAIPIIGIGFAVHSESQVDEEGKKEVNKGFDDKKIIDLVTEKNNIKWHALIAFTVNAAVFSLGLGIFPFACSILATGYLCLVLKNLAQMHANKTLIEEITAGNVVAPPGKNASVPHGKTEFIWSTSVE